MTEADAKKSRTSLPSELQDIVQDLACTYRSTGDASREILVKVILAPGPSGCTSIHADAIRQWFLQWLADLNHLPCINDGKGPGTSLASTTAKGPAEMLKLVPAVLNEEQRAKKLGGRAYMKPNGSEWAQEVLLKRFWAKWNEDLSDVLQASRKAAVVEIWNADWLNMRFWYFISPELGRAAEDLVQSRWVLGDRVFPRGPAPGVLEHCRGPAVWPAGVPLGGPRYVLAYAFWGV
jgi:hypothetical protein